MQIIHYYYTPCIAPEPVRDEMIESLKKSIMSLECQKQKKLPPPSHRFLSSSTNQSLSKCKQQLQSTQHDQYTQCCGGNNTCATQQDVKNKHAMEQKKAKISFAFLSCNYCYSSQLILTHHPNISSLVFFFLILLHVDASFCSIIII